jgi:hypothetical protein
LSIGEILFRILILKLTFTAGTLVSYTNKTSRHDITEILLKVALNTIALTLHCNGEY